MSRPVRSPRRLAAGSLLAATAAVLFLLPAPPEAEARPSHVKFFGKLYEKELDEETINKNKCNICHEATQKSKKFRNPYGMELAKVLGKNEKDEKVVVEALQKVAEKQSCVEKKTYGDLIKEGKLPADECPPVEAEDGKDLVPVPDPSMR